MQDQQSYDLYIENLIKDHQLALSEIQGESSLPLDSHTSSKIDEAIKQSQKIVQESLKLLEETQAASHFSSVQQNLVLQLQDQEEMSNLDYQTPQNRGYYKQASPQQQSQTKKESYIGKKIDESYQKYKAIIDYSQENPTQLENENKQLRFTNLQINEEKNELQEQIKNQQILISQMKLQIEQQQNFIAEQSKIKNAQIKDLEIEIQQVIKSKETLLNELHQKDLEIQSLKNKAQNSLNDYNISDSKQKFVDLEKKFITQNENSMKEIKEQQRKNTELKEKLVQAYEMSIKQRDVIRNLSTQSKDFQSQSINQEQNLFESQDIFQSNQKAPETPIKQVKQAQSPTQQTFQDKHILNIKTQHSQSQNKQRMFDQFEQQMKENEKKIQELEKRLTQQQQYLDISQKISSPKREVNYSLDLPKVKIVNKKLKNLGQTIDKKRIHSSKMTGSHRAIYSSLKRSSSVPKQSKNRGVR